MSVDTAFLLAIVACVIQAEICSGVQQPQADQRERPAELSFGASALPHGWTWKPGITGEALHHWPTAHALMRNARTSSHFAKSWASLSAQRAGDDPNAAPTAEENVASHFFISCGGHQARLCSECTVKDADGALTFNHGEDWCHGDCYWGNDEKCHLKKQEHLDGILSLPPPPNISVNSTSPVPEMAISNWSQEEKEDIHIAAERAIEESKFEADMEYGKAKVEHEENTPSKKFWFIVIITASVCLVCCACPAMVLVFAYSCFPEWFESKKLGGEESEGDSSAVEEDGEEIEEDTGDGYAA